MEQPIIVNALLLCKHIDNGTYMKNHCQIHFFNLIHSKQADINSKIYAIPAIFICIFLFLETEIEKKHAVTHFLREAWFRPNFGRNAKKNWIGGTIKVSFYAEYLYILKKAQNYKKCILLVIRFIILFKSTLLIQKNELNTQ